MTIRPEQKIQQQHPTYSIHTQSQYDADKPDICHGQSGSQCMFHFLNFDRKLWSKKVLHTLGARLWTTAMFKLMSASCAMQEAHTNTWIHKSDLIKDACLTHHPSTCRLWGTPPYFAPTLCLQRLEGARASVRFLTICLGFGHALFPN